jgi:hypothetical protein
MKKTRSRKSRDTVPLKVGGRREKEREQDLEGGHRGLNPGLGVALTIERSKEGRGGYF